MLIRKETQTVLDMSMQITMAIVYVNQQLRKKSPLSQ